MILRSALTQARKDVNWLCDVDVTSDGSFVGLDRVVANAPSANIRDGSVSILTYMLGHLANAVGTDVAETAIDKTWPNRSEVLLQR